MKRYARQIMLDDIGEEGQERLKAARVLVVGAGGLGCPVLTYLTCAGVGYIRIVDYDVVSLTNLNRQFFYGHEDIGKSKVLIARERLLMQNNEIEIDAIHERITVENIKQMLENIDIVVSCVDNIQVRLVMNKACVLQGIPLVEGGIEGFYGNAIVVQPESACLECLGYEQIYEELEKQGGTRSIPVIGVTAGVIGTIQANECLRLLLGLPSELVGKLLQYDGENLNFTKISIDISDECCAHNELNRRKSV